MGRIVRYRQCRNCRKRITTYEVPPSMVAKPGSWARKQKMGSRVERVGLNAVLLRNGNVASTDDWRSVLDPVVGRYRPLNSRGTRRRRGMSVRIGSERVWKHPSGRYHGRGAGGYPRHPAGWSIADAAISVIITRKTDTGRRPEPVQQIPVCSARIQHTEDESHVPTPC